MEHYATLDVLVMVDAASHPGVLISVRPVGVLEMVDQDGPDQKCYLEAHPERKAEQGEL